VGKPEGKRPLGRYKLTREVDIEIDVIEVEWGCMDWIHLAQDRDHWRAHVDTVMNFWVS
jgi:hypothetical protein